VCNLITNSNALHQLPTEGGQTTHYSTTEPPNHLTTHPSSHPTTPFLAGQQHLTVSAWQMFQTTLSLNYVPCAQSVAYFSAPPSGADAHLQNHPPTCTTNHMAQRCRQKRGPKLQLTR